MSLAETILKEWKGHDPFLQDSEGFQRYFEERYPKLLKESEKELNQQLKLLMRALTAPIIVHKCAWAEKPPEWLRAQIILDRFIALLKGEYNRATDSEALAYLMPASLEAPFDSDWNRIYLYLATKVLRSARKKVPSDVAVESLEGSYQKMLLNRLKEWIWDTQTEALKQRRGLTRVKST